MRATSLGDTRRGHISLPLDFDGVFDLVGDSAGLLFIRILLWSARLLKDGWVPSAVARRMSGRAGRTAADADVQRLVEAGLLRRHDATSLQVVDWERYALRSDEVAEHRARLAAMAPAGGRARAATALRDAAGRLLASAALPDSQPKGLVTGLVQASPVTDPGAGALTGVMGEDPPSEEEDTEGYRAEKPSASGAAGPRHPPARHPRGASVSAADLVLGAAGRRFNPAWRKASRPNHIGWGLPDIADFRRAWETRGFRRPPTEKQMAAMEKFACGDKQLLAEVLREVPPGLQSNEVVGEVVDRLRVRVSSHARSAPPEGRQERSDAWPVLDF